MKALFMISIFVVMSCNSNSKPEAPTNDAIIYKAKENILIDGIIGDSEWSNTNWRPINNVWLGTPMSENDFHGRYKLLWNENYIYILAETKDDVLMDVHEDGLDRYWDDDCLELFIDEDNSKGNHQYNHNAFAYHLSLDNKATDIGPDSLPHYYNHLKSVRQTIGDKSIWEVAMKVYTDKYQDGKNNTPIKLSTGKVLGFMLAYCDNDISDERENFIGSVPIEGEDKNRGWIDAGVFKSYQLK